MGMDAGRVAVSLLPPTYLDRDSKAAKKMVRSLDAQQLYIDRYLAGAPRPRGKQEALTMKLEALRNERLAREGNLLPSSQETESKSDKLQKEEEPVMPAVKWDELL